ncbi:MAG: hypothetical protein IKL09_02305 [Clostridia bacterium]|nr:hypothetical protein [Clostridia bacterium]
MKKIIFLLLAFLMLFVFSSCDVMFSREETTDCGYHTDHIYVKVKKECTVMGREYSPEEFDAELIKSVEVWNQIIPGKTNTETYNLDNYQHILILHLREPSLENAEKAIAAAERKDWVEMAMMIPNTLDVYAAG